MAAKDVCDSLTVSQAVSGFGETLHTNQVISAGLHGEEVGDPSRDIKAKDWVIIVSQAQKHPSITFLINFTRKNSWMQIWIGQRPCGYYQSPCCA